MVTFLELGKYGRIGNQMFQIAGTIGIATKMGYKFGFPYWRNYDGDKFGQDEDKDIQKYFKNPLPECEVRHFDTYNVKWGFHEVRPPDNVSIHGHLQSEKYFLHCKDLIKHYFTFNYDDTIDSNSVALHIRFGDYGSNYHPICDYEYYKKAIDFFPGYKILVFSDEPAKAYKLLGNGFTYIEGNHSTKDMYLMTLCRGHIIANSTFSWWGAWLSDFDAVIAPKRWFGGEAKISGNDIYCKEWIII